MRALTTLNESAPSRSKAQGAECFISTAMPSRRRTANAYYHIPMLGGKPAH